jgi:membrane protease YdiL (CAAX protease family)
LARHRLDGRAGHRPAAHPPAPLHRAEVDPATWLQLAGVSAIGFLLQTGSEVLFRGYLAQTVAARITRTTLIVGVPALSFALPHWGSLAAYGSNLTQLAPCPFMGITYGSAA